MTNLSDFEPPACNSLLWQPEEMNATGDNIRTVLGIGVDSGLEYNGRQWLLQTVSRRIET